ADAKPCVYAPHQSSPVSVQDLIDPSPVLITSQVSHNLRSGTARTQQVRRSHYHRSKFARFPDPHFSTSRPALTATYAVRNRGLFQSCPSFLCAYKVANEPGHAEWGS